MGFPRGYNKAILMGFLADDPDVRQSSKGTCIALLRVMTPEGRFNPDTKAWTEHNENHFVTVFGKAAENCGKYLRRGSHVFVEGRVHTSNYVKDGVKVWKTEILCENLVMVKGGAQGGGKRAYVPKAEAQEYSAPAAAVFPAFAPPPDEFAY